MGEPKSCKQVVIIDERLFHLLQEYRLFQTENRHGSHFELITVRIHTDAGIEGTGYTFTPGTSSMRAILAHPIGAME
jgi:L-alanine-DL-glutamate epimerase-like enolase superfamily enzyme